MNIIIACGAMPFSPRTLAFKSLGGSETAALMLAKALAERGHDVALFCNLPQQGPDAWPDGGVDAGVSFHNIAHFQQYAVTVSHDLLIGVRDPSFMTFPAQAKKKVLWMHDIATKKGMQRAFEQMSWAFDEVWTVSEWHRKQVHEATGYPLNSIKALRNGIVKVDIVPELIRREPQQLVYAARPERGLDNLIKPGGIMECLPEYNLKVAMYAHFPEEMRDYYNMIFARMKELPNVEFVGSLPQANLRALIAGSEAYIYPTQFEETSCILARECIEQRTPFLTTREGALPETLGDCGTFFEDWVYISESKDDPISSFPKGSPEWCKAFADFVRDNLNTQNGWVQRTQSRMENRTDLYWGGVAEMVEQNAQPTDVKFFSRLWSLVQDGDVMPARALAQQYLKDGGKITGPISGLLSEVFGSYSFVEGDIAAYYEKSYVDKGKTAESELIFALDKTQHGRYQAIRAEIAKLPPGSRVLEYGCGPGHVLAPLAKEFPLINFIGYDVSQSAIDVVNTGAKANELHNLHAAADPMFIGTEFTAVICTEVLEHVPMPWEKLTEIESYAKLGGRVIITVPFGAWEPVSYEREGHWHERFHLWSIDQQMFKEMQGEKPNRTFFHQPDTLDRFARPTGHLIVAYDADHIAAKPIDVLAKAKRHHPRQTVAACVIAFNNEDTILRMLNSLNRKVQFVQIALGPSTDNTREAIKDWFRKRPWMRYNILDVPKIEAWKFGFDDARNKSTEDIAEDFDWFLWIDTDEYLSGELSHYLRNNSLDGYLIAQHHFTVEPRGRAPEIDRPARLLRTGRGYAARGHIHEHFEIPAGGPGNCWMLPDVDIGHIGYVNEGVRKERFSRNWPFLDWDHQTEGAKRPLHHFLWFRDIIHRMRFAGIQGNRPECLKLAKEATEYYNDHAEDMATFGPGMFMALGYLAEANSALGIGVPIKITVQLDDRGATLESRFTNFDQVTRAMKQLLDPEFKDRLGPYYG